jgi:hypothetical protein
MGLQINQSFGRLGINTTDAIISIKSQRAAVKTTSRLPRIQTDMRPMQIHIDQKQCFCEVGLKTADVFTKAMAQASKQKGQRATASTARKGDFLARVNKNPKAIPVLAKSVMQKSADFTIMAMPKSRPKINFSGGMDINWDMGEVELETTAVKQEIYAGRAGVEVYMIQRPYIEIEYKGRLLDTII